MPIDITNLVIFIFDCLDYLTHFFSKIYKKLGYDNDTAFFLLFYLTRRMTCPTLFLVIYGMSELGTCLTWTRHLQRHARAS